MTDDIRDDAASAEAPDEEPQDAAEGSQTEDAPTAQEPVDWEKRYKERERTVSRQGEELSLLRREVDALRQRPAPEQTTAQPEEYASLPPAVAQELAYYRQRVADVETQEITAAYGDEFVDALDYFERAVRIDGSRRGRASALVATINRLASAEQEAEAPAAPAATRPKAPTRMETNRPDTAPPADIAKYQRDAERDPGNERKRSAFIGALFDAAGVKR